MHLNALGLVRFSRILGQRIPQGYPVAKSNNMLFNSTQFLIFLMCVLALFYVSPLRLRRFVLLGASYLFYMNWIPKFLILLMSLTLVDF